MVSRDKKPCKMGPSGRVSAIISLAKREPLPDLPHLWVLQGWSVKSKKQSVRTKWIE